MYQNNFKGKRILITGIRGFIGASLKEELELRGAHVFGMSRSNSDNKQILKSNILNYKAINQFVKEKKIQICYHLASDALVEHGQLYPHKTFKVNIEGTLNILEIARINNFEKIIIASTSHVYGKNKVPYRESYMPKPTRPYETSKACADLIAQSYAKNFNIPVLIPRFVNIYGPGDLNFERIIPKTMKSVISGLNPTMWGGTARREYLYIDDAVAAYCSLGLMDTNKIASNTVINLGSSNVISVEDLMQLIINISGKDLKIQKTNSIERDEEIPAQYVSSSRAKKVINWQPRINIQKGIIKTYSWYQSYFNNMR